MLRSHLMLSISLVASLALPCPAAQDSTAALVKQLKSPDAKQRAEAAFQLAMECPPAQEALPALIETLNDPNQSVGKTAAHAVARYGNDAERCAAALIKQADRLGDSTVLAALARLRPKGKEAVMFCVKALAAKDTLTRIDAAKTLEKMGPPARGAVPGLVSALDNVSEPLDDLIFRALHIQVSDALNAIGSPGAEEVPALGLLLRHKAQPVRLLAAAMLLSPGIDTKPVVQDLIDALGTEKNADVKWRIIDGIAAARPNTKGAVPPLIETLKDSDEFVVRAAVKCLGEMGKVAKPAEKTLVDVFRRHSAPRCRAAAAVALIQIAPESHTKDALNLLDDLLLNKEGEVRMASANALAQVGTAAKPLVPGLVKAFLKEEAVYVRSPIAQAVHAIAPEIAAKEVTPKLVADLKSADQFVRWWAALALAKIDRKAAGKVAGLTLFEAANEDRGSPINWDAARAFDQVADDAVPLLVEKLEGNVLRYKHGLSRLGDGSAVALVKSLKDNSDLKTRLLVAYALGEMGPAAKKATPALVDAFKGVDALTDKEFIVRRKLILAVALTKIDTEIAGKEALDFLIQSLNHTEVITLKGTDGEDDRKIDRGQDVRREAAVAIGRIGHGAYAAIPALKKAAEKDKDESVRKAAAASMKAICP